MILSEEFAARARNEIDTDEPSIDGLQATLLLVIAFIGAGKGKKAYMLMSTLNFLTRLSTNQFVQVPNTDFGLSNCHRHGNGP